MLFGKKSGGCRYIIAGLGNPGAKYEMSRHNAGFRAAGMLAREEGFDIKRLKFHALTARADICGESCLVMLPQTFMNNSGEAIGEAAKFYKIPPQRIIVFSDDISLDVGRIRVRRKGSAGGHNGLKSIIAHLGSEDFPRVKIGVGKKPNAQTDLADWVLGRFPKESEEELRAALEHACEAARLIISGETDRAMNLYN